MFLEHHCTGMVYNETSMLFHQFEINPGEEVRLSIAVST